MAEAAIQEVVSKLVEYLADALKNQVSYLCCYSCNVQTLADEIRDLNIRHDSVQQDVDAARANAGVIRPEVESWLEKVVDVQSRSNKIFGDAEEVQRNFMRKWFPVLQYFLSRNAMKTTINSVELRQMNFANISNPGIPAEIALVPSPSEVEFRSRDFIEGSIMDALKNASVYSIGIWGIGGVGKTTMAKKIEEKVRDDKSMFQHVVMVVVSQQPDVKMIQSHIAEGLGLNLREESEVYRRRKLHERLMAEKSILIILDDLWQRLDLEELGIPSQSTHASCKIILTSRNRDALTSSGVSIPYIFRLDVLTEEESWNFFKENAEILDDGSDNDLVQIAKKVEWECQRLPLALKIVGRALRGQDKTFWNNAVQELEKSVADSMPDVTKDVYGPLLYSINTLEGNGQKDLFLLCCLFPEDYSISIEELVRCGVGLKIFKGYENLAVVRDKVEILLKFLLARSLLLEGYGFMNNLCVKMHDVIRDVGIWITSKEMVTSNKEKNVFMVRHGEKGWPEMEEDSCNNYTCISLVFSHHNIRFPESIHCPNLKFLRLDLDKSISVNGYYVMLPEKFFSGMGELRVLEAFDIHFPPQSIGQLNNLRTLFLEKCNICETASVLGKLINLKILNFSQCEIVVLPLEMGGLKNLKQMFISKCTNLRRIAFGVISGLVRLEELVIWDSFDSWEAEVGEGKEIACLSELNDLSKLTTLKIEIRNPVALPRKKPLWIQKVKKYSITISKCNFDIGKEKFEKAILLGKEVVNPLKDWIYNLASDAEYLNLEGSNCMKFVERLSGNCGNLSCLKWLRLSQFTNITYLVVEGQQNDRIYPMLESLRIENSMSFRGISEVPPPTGSFVALQRISLHMLGLACLWKFSTKERLYLVNLKFVDISFCFSLSHLFSASVVQSLVQLSHITISYCPSMKEIFKYENDELMEINKIELPELRYLFFSNLRSFCRLCNGIDRIELPKLVSLYIDNLPNFKLTEEEGDNNEVQPYLISQVRGMSFNFCMLESLEVKGIGSFKYMFSSSVIITVPNLKRVDIKSCSMLEQVIGKDDENVEGTVIFPNLQQLTLTCLSNISAFCCNAIQFPSLEYLYISECPQMLSFVVEVPPDGISNSRPFIDKQVECPKLEKLLLEKLNISRLFCSDVFKSLTNLGTLDLSDCKELEHLITKEKEKGQSSKGKFIQMVPSTSFSLIRLPKLRGYVFDMNQDLEFPFLEHIQIEDCPMLEKFSDESLCMPKLKKVSGLLNAEFAANFFFHKQEMSSHEIRFNNDNFIVPIKDISFIDSVYSLSFLAPDSSESFLNAISFFMDKKIVGKFKVENIPMGIEYEIMLMINFNDYDNELEDTIEIELKLPEGEGEEEDKLQHCEFILENQSRRDVWTEISIGRFTRKSEQKCEELEFSFQRRRNMYLNLSIKGVRIVKV